MRIAVVGTGISGLLAAHLLHPEHEITVFEANDYLGGHTNTIRVDTAEATYHVDTGFIVFNDRNYPGFEKLLAKLGVASQPTTMSFSVKGEPEDFEYNGNSLNGLFAQRANLARPAFYRMIRDLLRFNREVTALVEQGDDDVSLGHFLETGRYGRDFIDRLIVPQASAVWSADPAQMWAFPVRFLAQFFANHGMLGLRGRPQWRTVVGGSRSYVEAIVAPFRERIRLATPVESILRHPDHVELTPRGAEPQRFDEVVIATHSDQALALLADASEREHEVLGSIAYQHNEAVLHTDRSLLPRRRRAWAAWNYHLLPEPIGRTTVTYHMNTLQRLSAEEEFCVTLNRTEAIDPAKIIRRISYAHPVFTPSGVAAQGEHASITGVNRTHFCGAYWGWGFHEDGVRSAERAVERLRAARVPA